jgi:hypothetical protein
MRFTGHTSLNNAAAATEGYPRLIVCLCEHFGIPLIRHGSITFIRDGDLNELRCRVAEWKDRPKLSRLGGGGHGPRHHSQGSTGH